MLNASAEQVFNLIKLGIPDEEIFRHERIALPGRTDLMLSISVASIPGDPTRLNEDSYAVSFARGRIRFLVADGTTYLGPAIPGLNQTPGREAALYLRDELVMEHGGLLPEDLLLALNRRLLNHSRRLLAAPDLQSSSTASTASLVEIDYKSDAWRFAHVSDTFILAKMTDGSTTMVTRNTNERFDREVFDLIREVSELHGITPREARYHPDVVERLAQVTRNKNNLPDGTGTGLMNGDPNVAKYIQFGHLPLEMVSAFIIGSDGSLPVGYDPSLSEHQELLFTMLDTDAHDGTSGVRRLMSLKRQTEQDDPDWNKQIRWKPSDDGTVVFVKIERPQPEQSDPAVAAWPSTPSGAFDTLRIRGIR